MEKFSKEELNEAFISTKRVFEGVLLKVDKDSVKLPNGKITTRELVRHPGAVAVVAITDQNEIIFVEQYRYPLGTVMLEIPAGKLDLGEEPLACAKRELSEETGFEAAEWIPLNAIATTPGFSDEVIHLFVAKKLKQFYQHTDSDEFITIKRFSMDTVKMMVAKGIVYDAKTICALFAYELFNNNNSSE